MPVIHQHSVRKYENGKSKLTSAAIKIPVIGKELGGNPTATDIVDWFDCLRKQYPYGSIRQLTEEKLQEIIDRQPFCNENRSWRSGDHKGIQSIVLTKETTVNEFVLWLSKQPQWGVHYQECIEGMEAFLRLKSVAKLQVA